MVASARSMVDWKHYVKTYPWVCLGTAAALGFLIVPKRSTAIHPDLATLTELARTGHLVAEPAPAATRRIGRCAIGDRRQHRGSQGNRIVGAKCRKITGKSGSAPPSRRRIPTALRIARVGGADYASWSSWEKPS